MLKALDTLKLRLTQELERLEAMPENEIVEVDDDLMVAMQAVKEIANKLR